MASSCHVMPLPWQGSSCAMSWGGAERSSLQAQHPPSGSLRDWWQRAELGRAGGWGALGPRGLNAPGLGQWALLSCCLLLEQPRQEMSPRLHRPPEAAAWSGGGDERDQSKPRCAAVRGHEGKMVEVTATCIYPGFTGLVSPDKVKPSDRPIYFCKSHLSGGDEQWTRPLMTLRYW